MENVEQAIVDWLGMATAYQQRWWADRHKKHRHYVNARQIGTTMAMAIEAGMVHLETGRPQAFIAPSVNQARLFVDYLRANVRGRKWIYGREVWCLSPNCALPLAGLGDEDLLGSFDVYVDSYRWMGGGGFAKVRSAAEALVGADGRITWLSTGEPSSPKYDPVAYRFWRDDTARESMTIHDAIAGGLSVVDVDYLRSCYTPDEFARAFECRIPEVDGVAVSG